jgi:hypothetical protein
MCAKTGPAAVGNAVGRTGAEGRGCRAELVSRFFQAAQIPLLIHSIAKIRGHRE